MVSFLCYFWFRKSEQQYTTRQSVIVCIFSCIISIAVARALALSLPFRVRPIENDALHFIKPYGSQALELITWSSFPSDNAVMFFSLATGFFLISKKLGIAAFAYVLALICFPRMYLGYHFPTDILVGAILGILITLTVSANIIKDSLTKVVMRFKNNYTGAFYTLTFLLLYELARMFHEVRLSGSYLVDVVHRLS